jgi:molybdate transport system substrate-binding protein
LVKSIIRPSLHVALIAGALASIVPDRAGAAEITFLCAAAIESWMHDVIPQFEKASGHTVKPTFLVTNNIAERVRKGDVADLVAVSPPQWEALQREGKLDPDIRIAIAKVGYGVFVKQGATRPDISSVEALKRALLNARSIAFLPPLPGGGRGPTGVYQVRLVEQLGVSADIKQKIVESSAPRPGQVITAPFFELVASGGAEIGVAMISEILHAPGVDFVGPVPPEVRDFIVFTTGIPTIAEEPAAAKALIAFLTSPTSSSILNSKGLEQP